MEQAHNKDRKRDPDQKKRAARWSELPARVLPEDMTEVQADADPPVDLGLDLNRENWIRYV